MKKPSLRKIFLLLFMLPVCVVTQAKDPKARAELEPATYPRWNKTALGETYPTDGPIVKVYAKGTSDTYSVVTEQTRMRKAAINYKASCNDCSSCKKSLALVDGPSSDDIKKSKKGKLVYLDVPYTALEKLKPVELCNREAENISVVRNMPLHEVVKKGFAVKVDSGLRASATTMCTYSKGGFKDQKAKGDSAQLAAWVVCSPNPGARSNGGARKTTITRAGKAPTSSARANTKPVPVPSQAVSVKKAKMVPVTAAKGKDSEKINKPIKPIRLEPKVIEEE